MPTVGKNIADNIATNDGYYQGDKSPDGDTRCVEITEYDNMYGGIGYGLTYDGQPNRYTASEYVRNPRCYWKAK